MDDYDSDASDSDADSWSQGSDDDSETDDAENLFREWTSVESNNKRPREREFLGASGLLYEPDLDEVLSYVDAMISDVIWSYIAFCTNCKADLLFSDDSSAASHARKWQPVNVQKMKQFFATLLFTGLNKKPSWKSYWSRDELYEVPLLKCKNTLSRDEFLQILRCVRFSDPRDPDSCTKSGRLSYFCEQLKKAWSNYTPSQQIAIDESLLLFKGRLAEKQFIPSKRSRFGVKIFELCDAGQCSGYLCDFEIYLGKKTSDIIKTYICDNFGDTTLSLTEQIVCFFLSRRMLLGQNFHVYVDNWYCSTRLAAFLVGQDIMLTGTIKPLRGVPKPMVDCKLVDQETRFTRKDGVMVCKYADRKKDVYVLSTNVDLRMETKLRRRKGAQNGREQVNVPAVIQDYNAHMGGVDVASQELKPYSFIRKHLRGIRRLASICCIAVC